MILQDVFHDSPIGDEWFMEHGFKTALEGNMSVCTELGCPEPPDPATAGWDEWLDSDKHPISLIRQYLVISTTIDFDPPRNPTTLNVMNGKREELMFRIRTHVEKMKGAE